jgi:hypothetical protein
MRGALGASRGRVMQQMIVEGLVLSGCAAVLGTGLALSAIKLTGAVAPIHLNVDFSTHVDFTILAGVCGLTLLSAVLSAAWPALIAVRAPIEPALKQGGQQAGSGRRHNRLRSGLVAVEVAMSLTLLVACGLLLRTIYTLRHVPLGYRTDHIIVANLSIPSYRYVEQERDGDAVSAAAGAGATAARGAGGRTHQRGAAGTDLQHHVVAADERQQHCCRAEDSEPGYPDRSSASRCSPGDTSTTRTRQHRLE